MQILLNGEPYELDAGTSVKGLLDRLAIDPRVVAVELNRLVVRKARFETTVIPEHAEVEIVAFVGGGGKLAT
jgi:sulfur carrier protein